MKRKNRTSRIVRLILIIVLASAACGGFIFFGIKAIVTGNYFTGDAWLGFWGSIIGSAVTMIGITLTLSFESKQNNMIRRLEAQPIITLKALSLLDEHTENESSYSLRVSGGNEETLSFVLPDIRIQNIGLNFATKVEHIFHFETPKNCFVAGGFNPLSIIDAKETKQISMDFHISKDLVYDFFNNSYVVNKNEFPHACYALTMMLLAEANRKESAERLEKISFTSGELITTFEDIYGNAYEQKRTVKIYYVEVRDEDPFVYMTCPNFSDAELIKRKKNR